MGQGKQRAKELNLKQRKRTERGQLILAFPTLSFGQLRPHLCGYRLPGARGLLPTPLEVGAVSWTLGLRPGAISGALAGLGLTIPTFCGRLLGWPRAERPRKETISDRTGAPRVDSLPLGFRFLIPGS